MKTRLILLFLLFRLTDVFGQSPYFQQYFLLKKNDVVQIEAIMKDRKGFMWFGTNKGLFRFDGLNTRRFTKADSLAIDHVTALAQDSSGRIWIGHKNGQLSVLEKDVIHKVDFPEGDAVAEVSDILFTKDGTMWFSTLNDGLYYYHEHLYRLDEGDGMPDIFVYDLEEDERGAIWAGTDRGVAVVKLNDNKPSIRVLDYKSGFPDNIIRKIVKGDGNEMWLATEDAGVFSFDPASNKPAALTKSPWSGGGVIDFLKIGDEFWIATNTSSIVVYDQSDDQLSYYSPGQGTAPTALYADEEGSVWVGARNGLFRSLGRDVRFIDEPRGATAVTVDHDNNIWYSNDYGLFTRRIDKDGKVNTDETFVAAAAAGNKVISLYTDSIGNVWCGFYGSGVVVFPVNKGVPKIIRNELSNGSILSISGTGNNIWLSTLNGASLVEIDKNFKVTNFNRTKGLDVDYVYQVYSDSKQRTWFASDREGVVMRDNTGFHKILGSLAGKAIYGFAEDSTGTIWANVQDDGLYKFDGQQFQPGVLRNINVNCLSADPAGNLVAVHDLGIEVYSPKNNTVHHLDNEIGFGERKSNLNAVATDNHGNIYFGTDHGLVIYGQSHVSDAKPRAAINRFRVFDKDRDWTQQMSFSYDDNNISISFIGLWYQDPQGVQFQYKLENYDVNWISTGDHSVIYSSLPPGTYTFHVAASNTAKYDHTYGDSVTFTIRPPFWQTLPFYALVGVAVVALGYSYMRARERSLQREKIELEEKVAERTAEIIKKNEEILAQSEEIKAINESLERRVAERTFELEKKNKALEEYAFINAHNLRSPVASLLGLINLITHAKTEAETKEITEHMKISAERLDEVVHTITESIERSDQMEAFDHPSDDDDGID